MSHWDMLTGLEGIGTCNTSIDYVTLGTYMSHAYMCAVSYVTKMTLQ